MLKAHELRVSYGGLPALKGVSLEVGAGELVSIIGANGAGKTTLLRAISGTVPASGELTLKGQPLTGVPGHLRSRLGLVHVPQGRHVFPQMTVQDNLLVAATYRGDLATLDFIYDLFPILKTKRSQPAGQLSGGQQQMLAIGRGLMSDPVLLMLDEPSTGLSPVLVDDILGAIQRIRSTRNLSILLVEQRATSALDISDRAYVVEQGQVALSGPSASLRSDDRVRRAYLGL